MNLELEFKEKANYFIHEIKTINTLVDMINKDLSLDEKLALLWSIEELLHKLQHSNDLDALVMLLEKMQDMQKLEKVA